MSSLAERAASWIGGGIHILPPSAVAAIVLKAEKAREYAEIHQAACRWRRQGAVCSRCSDLDERAARLAKLAGEVEEWGPDSAAQMLERGPR